MQVSFFTKGVDCLVAKISGELDHHSAQKVRNEADSRIVHGRAKNLVFDFSDLSFMDSSGIGVIIGRYNLVKSCGGDVAIVCHNVSVNKILKMSGIPKIIEIYSAQNEIPKKFIG